MLEDYIDVSMGPLDVPVRPKNAGLSELIAPELGPTVGSGSGRPEGRW